MGRMSEAQRAYVNRDEFTMWESSEPATKLCGTPFDMDGSLHMRGNSDACCGIHSRPCDVCGVGTQHFQPVYGGIYYECDVCEAG